MSLGTSAALLLGLLVADPRVTDPAYELELIASEPDLVTPVGLAFDDRGRLLVVESHTHFRPEDYQGPPADRIRIVEPDGSIKRSYYEGTKYTMGLRPGPDGWMYVATRMEVFRLRDADGDGTAETREEVAHLDTKGDYPHNGLSGLAVGPDRKLYFGMGENLGAPYELIGSDGKRLPGGGEGGNVFRCGLDGSGLEQIATGFWNPFGLCFDPQGRLYAVDNDPDASPPCRLLHVVPGGDYGFQFRYGRAGKHPLQAWDGELPGTLPMAAGTGEAPCAVVPHEGRLWVTSWGHHRIERFTMKPKGATVVGTPEIVVQGDENFRPVDLAAAENGDLYFTDWVDKSYPLHGKGRLWRLKKKADAPASAIEFPSLSDDERRADGARARFDSVALDSEDPFLHTAAVWGAATEGPGSFLKWKELSARQRLGMLEAANWQNVASDDARDELLKTALREPSADIRLYAVRWVADQRIERLRDEVSELLDRTDSPPASFRAVVAALDVLDGTKPDKKTDPLARVAAILTDESRPATVRAMALQSLPADSPALTPHLLTELAKSDDPNLAREAVRTMAVRGDLTDALTKIARDESRPEDVRADAAVGLATALAPAQGGSRITANDPASWAVVLEAKDGNADAGWRVFFRSNGAACSRCHTLGGRGAAVGPDLTGIGRRMDRARLLESILRPSAEVAPQYVPWTLVTTDGRVLVGLPIEVRDTPEGTEHFVGNDGKRFEVRSEEIAERRASEASLMPDGLEKLMTAEEIRDLLAALAE